VNNELYPQGCDRYWSPALADARVQARIQPGMSLQSVLHRKIFKCTPGKSVIAVVAASMRLAAAEKHAGSQFAF
jgi:hypothetical protein